MKFHQNDIIADYNLKLQSISNFKIPLNDEFKVHGAPCDFQLDCSYNISINTINTPSHMGSVIYHVDGNFKRII